MIDQELLERAEKAEAEMKQITIDEYDALCEYREKHDAAVAARREGLRRYYASLTPEQRSARAKKAVAARIKKYNQKGRK